MLRFDATNRFLPTNLADCSDSGSEFDFTSSSFCSRLIFGSHRHRDVLPTTQRLLPWSNRTSVAGRSASSAAFWYRGSVTSEAGARVGWIWPAPARSPDMTNSIKPMIKFAMNGGLSNPPIILLWRVVAKLSIIGAV